MSSNQAFFNATNDATETECGSISYGATSENNGIAAMETDITEENNTLVETNNSEEKKRLVLGILLSIAYCLTITLSVPCLQLLGPEAIGSMELLFLAYAAHVLTSVPVWMVCWRALRTLDWYEVIWLTVAGIANGLSTACFYLVSEELPAGVVGAVAEGSYLLFSVLGTLILDRHMSKLVIIATVVCALGLVMFALSATIVDPLHSAVAVHLPELNGTMVTYSTLHGQHPALAYVLMFICSILLVAGNLIIHRRFPKVHFSKLLLFFPVWGLITTVLTMYCFIHPDWIISMTSPQKYLPFLGFITLFILSAITLYSSWMRTPAPIFGLISAGSILLYFILQYTVLVPGIYPGYPDALEIIGALLILLGNIIGPLSELNASPCQSCLEKRFGQ